MKNSQTTTQVKRLMQDFVNGKNENREFGSGGLIFRENHTKLIKETIRLAKCTTYLQNSNIAMSFRINFGNTLIGLKNNDHLEQHIALMDIVHNDINQLAIHLHIFTIILKLMTKNFWSETVSNISNHIQTNLASLLHSPLNVENYIQHPDRIVEILNYRLARNNFETEGYRPSIHPSLLIFYNLFTCIFDLRTRDSDKDNVVINELVVKISDKNSKSLDNSEQYSIDTNNNEINNKIDNDYLHEIYNDDEDDEHSSYENDDNKTNTINLNLSNTIESIKSIEAMNEENLKYDIIHDNEIIEQSSHKVVDNSIIENISDKSIESETHTLSTKSSSSSSSSYQKSITSNSENLHLSKFFLTSAPNVSSVIKVNA